MKVSQVLYFTASIFLTASTCVAEEWRHIQKLIRAGEVPCRGVNLGGWLVLEQYMTEGASFWEDIDEEKKNNGEYYLMTQTKDYDKTYKAVAKHHAEFITEDDIEEIAKAGMNTVRIPVGWWLRGVDDADMFVNDTLKYLDLLVKKWAVKHDLAVLVDIHAARGGQNAMEMSAPFAEGKAGWASDPLNIQNTIDFAVFLAGRYSKQEAFLGIGLLNEPTYDTDEDKLYQYYQDAYKAVREVDENCILVISPQLHKQNPSAMIGFMEEPEFKYVWVDWHPYFKWGYENAQDAAVLGAVKSQSARVDEWNLRDNHNILMSGEWSLAVRDGQFEGNEEGYYDFAQEQVSAYNKMEGGWTYWSWRIFGDEEFDAWSMRSVLRDERFSTILLSDAKAQRAERDAQRPPPTLPPTTTKATPKPTPSKTPIPTTKPGNLDASMTSGAKGSEVLFSILAVAFSLLTILHF